MCDYAEIKDPCIIHTTFPENISLYKITQDHNYDTCQLEIRKGEVLLLNNKAAAVCIWERHIMHNDRLSASEITCLKRQYVYTATGYNSWHTF